jgi:hypothetical protein
MTELRLQTDLSWPARPSVPQPARRPLTLPAEIFHLSRLGIVIEAKTRDA